MNRPKHHFVGTLLGNLLPRNGATTEFEIFTMEETVDLIIQCWGFLARESFLGVVAGQGRLEKILKLGIGDKK